MLNYCTYIPRNLFVNKLSKESVCYLQYKKAIILEFQ